jgi:phosphopantothenoylcysteine decarboxylase / phosphopantothenate---cysteine ligase
MKLLVTAGPTREAIDPVRFISNRSTGKMGYAVARAARGRGHEVCLVSGPVCLAPPDGVRIVGVTSADELLEAVHTELEWCEALVMAAAVADWRPSVVAGEKLKKATMESVLSLERTPDVLASIQTAKGNRIFVGFAAETQNLVEEAGRKLREKGLDLIVANDVSRADAGFEADTNQVVLLSADGTRESLPLQSKAAVGERIVEWVEDCAGKRGSGRG